MGTKTRTLGLVVVLSCWGCAGADRAVPQPATPAAQPPANAEPKTTSPEPVPTHEPQIELGDEDFRSFSYSLSLRVDDPAAAHAWMRGKLREHGGEVSSASVNADRGNISARLTDEAYVAFMRDLEQVQGMIASESTSTRDNRSTVANIQRKLRTAQEAAAFLAAEAKGLEHGEQARALVRLHELNEAERVSLENQLRSYLQQSEYNDVHISLERLR